MRVTARTEYALRALLALAAAEPAAVTAGALATAEEMPLTFLKTILHELRGADLVVSRRGTERGYRLTRPPAQISVGEVIRVVDGSLTRIRGEAVDLIGYRGPATHLWQVWVAADRAVLDVVDSVTLADLVTGRLPAHILALSRPR